MKNKTIALALALVAAICIAGCSMSFESSFDDSNTLLVENDNGFSFRLPQDWLQADLEEDSQLQCAYLSPERSVELSVLMELGGVEYFSLEEICGQMADQVSAAVLSRETDRQIKAANDSCTVLLEGLDAQGQAVVCRLEAQHPFSAGRYYLLFIASADAYDDYRRVIDGIASSFSIDIDAEGAYQLMQAQRDAEAEAAAAAAEDASNNAEDATAPEEAAPNTTE